MTRPDGYYRQPTIHGDRIVFALLHGNLSHRLPGARTFLMDEEETYETASIRPVSHRTQA